ncbi:MAG TPA: M20/M25/M40 family metallo-hydrolase [Planctomycetota bacterium]
MVLLPPLAHLLALVAAPQTPAAPPAPVPDITRAELEHHVRFLASDELGGRLPGTAGMERAKAHLAEALAAAGVEPAGDDGTFFQLTGHVRVEVTAPPRLLLTHESGEVRELVHGQDFQLRPRGRARSTEVLPLRFFYDYNHARMPLAGNAAEALYFSAQRAEKRRILKEKGIESLEDWGLELEIRQMDDAEEPGEPGLPPSRMLAPDVTEGCELVELRGPILADFQLRKFTHVQLLVDEAATPHVDANVVGRIRGRGTAARAELSQEVVLLSAHYDHLGLRPRPRGPATADALCNGADDNASGCAALLELAQAFASAPPARTLVVLFTTGEESGGIGARRYLAAPAEPLARTVGNLNLEMLGRPDELVGGAGKLWLTGWERSNVGPAWSAQGLAIVADPRPKQSFFTRSDNYAFALEGVVAQTLSSFGEHAEYHTPRDEADTLDYAHLEAAARVAFAAARTLADGSLTPVWLEGQRPQRPKPPDFQRGKGEPGEEKERELRSGRSGRTVPREPPKDPPKDD